MPIVFPEENRNLYMSVATYEAIPTPVAIGYMKRALAILEPYLANPEVRFWVRWTPVGSRTKARSLRHLNWEEIANDFPVEGIEFLLWKDKLRGTEKNPHVGGVSIKFYPEDPEMAAHLQFSVNPLEVLGAKEISRAVQDQVVDLAVETFVAVKGIVGYITVDYLVPSGYGTMSPYERFIGLEYLWAAREFRRKARGYYWGNLLSNGHVELLGGEAALEKAPVYLVKKLENGYYLQLTEDINNIDREKLAQLKEFLKPLLPEGYPQSPEYYENLPNYVL